VNPPGVGASGLRVAVELLSGTKIDPAALQGTAKNTLFVPIPFIVDKTNFEAQYAAVKDLPASYTLDGIISQDEAKQLMAGKFKIEAPKAATPAATMAATKAATPAK
jgi:ribose transport system substrate-binding protein